MDLVDRESRCLYSVKTPRCRVSCTCIIPAPGGDGCSGTRRDTANTLRVDSLARRTWETEFGGPALLRALPLATFEKLEVSMGTVLGHDTLPGDKTEDLPFWYGSSISCSIRTDYRVPYSNVTPFRLPPIAWYYCNMYERESYLGKYSTLGTR